MEHLLRSPKTCTEHLLRGVRAVFAGKAHAHHRAAGLEYFADVGFCHGRWDVPHKHGALHSFLPFCEDGERQARYKPEGENDGKNESENTAGANAAQRACALIMTENT